MTFSALYEDLIGKEIKRMRLSSFLYVVRLFAPFLCFVLCMEREREKNRDMECSMTDCVRFT